MDHKFVRTTCPYCGCGCELLLEVLDGKLLGTLPSKTNPMNQGNSVSKVGTARFHPQPEPTHDPHDPQGRWTPGVLMGRGPGLYGFPIERD